MLTRSLTQKMQAHTNTLALKIKTVTGTSCEKPSQQTSIYMRQALARIRQRGQTELPKVTRATKQHSKENMKAKITDKSELRLSDLTREYTFDILADDDTPILTSQIVTSQPSQVRARLQEIVAEYQAVFADENDVIEGDEIGN